jgi:hypothetical protein
MRPLSMLFLFLLIAGCASGPAYVPANAPAAVSPTAVKAGDFWEYRVTDAYTGFDRGIYRYEVTRTDGDRIVVALTHAGRLIDTLVYSAGWNSVDAPLTNLERWHYNPPFPAYAYPLAPGKTWYTVVKATDPVTRQTYRVHTRGKVVGWERIRVPAGEFDALRIQRYVYAGNSDARRTQEEIIETDWYVPAVRRAAVTEGSSQHFDNSRGGGGEGAGEYPLRIRGDWLRAELVRYSQ